MILIGIVGFRLAGKFLKHAANLMVLGWHRMLRAAIIAALVSIVGTEVLACVSTGRFPPPVLAQVVVAVLAVVLAYCAALTVLIFEIFAGSLEMIPMLIGDVEADARSAATTVEHEAGNVRDSLRRLVGLRPKPASAERTIAELTLPTLAARAFRGRAPTNSRPQSPPMDDEELTLPPPPRVVAQPVPASQLPRIAWTYDEPLYTPSRPPVTPPPVEQAPVAPAAPPREEPLAPPAISIAEEWTHESVAPTEDGGTLARKPTVRVATAQAVRVPLPPIPEEQLQPRPTRPLGSTTRPISSTTRPLGRVTRPLREASNSGGLWERVSQVLVGRVEEPTERDESPAASTPPEAISSEAEQNL